MDRGFAGCAHDSSIFGTPTHKPLRQTLPQGNMKGLTEPFYMGTNTVHDILAKGWVLGERG